jgi:hypothetical protein
VKKNDLGALCATAGVRASVLSSYRSAIARREISMDKIGCYLLFLAFFLTGLVAANQPAKAKYGVLLGAIAGAFWSYGMFVAKNRMQ